MKKIYVKPEIQCEVLQQEDVLLSSTATDNDNAFTKSSSLIQYVFSGEWLD